MHNLVFHQLASKQRVDCLFLKSWAPCMFHWGKVTPVRRLLDRESHRWLKKQVCVKESRETQAKTRDRKKILKGVRCKKVGKKKSERRLLFMKHRVGIAFFSLSLSLLFLVVENEVRTWSHPLVHVNVKKKLKIKKLFRRSEHTKNENTRKYRIAILRKVREVVGGRKGRRSRRESNLFATSLASDVRWAVKLYERHEKRILREVRGQMRLAWNSLA